MSAPPGWTTPRRRRGTGSWETSTSRKRSTWRGRAPPGRGGGGRWRSPWRSATPGRPRANGPKPTTFCPGVGGGGAWTVTELAGGAGAVVEGGLGPLWVRGEISGFKAWQSGHWYFALRDRNAQIRCVMFQKENRRLPTPPADGMQVFAFARPTVWEEKGEFRLTILDLLSTAAGGLLQGGLARPQAA